VDRVEQKPAATGTGRRGSCSRSARRASRAS
jgi:hypothetical protein